MENQEKYERYIPVEMSILGSLLEIREMQAGRMPKPTLEDFFVFFLAEIKLNIVIKVSCRYYCHFLPPA